MAKEWRRAVKDVLKSLTIRTIGLNIFIFVTSN